MKRSHLPFRWMGNFKAVAADYEYYLTLSDKPVSVCLTERQMYIMSVWNTYTPWMTRWYNTDDVSEAQLQLIAAELEDLLMCGCGVPELSFTDRINMQTYTVNTSTTYQTTYNTWNTGGQTVISIAPDLDYGTGTPANIDKILCLALEMILIAIVESAKAVKQGTEQQAKDTNKNLGNIFGALSTAGGVGLAAGGTAAAVVGFLGGPYLILGLALAAVGTAIANLLWTTDLSVYEDVSAQQQVLCTLVNNIVGETPTRARFQAGLTPNAFTPGSNAEKLAAIVQPYLDDLDTYLQFLSTTQGLYDVANFGILPDCSCGFWCHFDDLAATNGGFVAEASYDGDWANIAPFGQGWHSGIDVPTAIRELYIARTLPFAATLTSITIDFDYWFEGAVDASARIAAIQIFNGATLVVSESIPLETVAGTYPGNTLTWEGTAVGNIIKVLIIPVNKVAPPVPDGDARLYRIQYEGLLLNPFGSSNC